MRKAFATLVGALVLLAPATALADPQPTEGINSTGRNEAGFGGGPHCHVLISAGNQEAFEEIRVFPSHTAHLASGIGHVFNALPETECPTLAD
jgi:hypothetical protein